MNIVCSYYSWNYYEEKMMDKGEKERKELNRKLMTRTFINQMKNTFTVKMKNEEEYKFIVFKRKRFLEVLNIKRSSR